MSEKCFKCPRNCGAARSEKAGFCGGTDKIRIARASPHFWEEPCISGTGGSGAVFFSGCPLKCVYCQNHTISSENFGEEVTRERLEEIYGELIWRGVHNIDLITGSHYIDEIIPTLKQTEVPFVWNTSSYEKISELKKLDGKIQIYLPDLKYSSKETAEKYSNAPNYPKIAIDAIKEMYRQTGPYKIDSDGIMISGVIIRHLVLPGELENTYGVIDAVSEEFKPGEVMFSLMSQYTPIVKNSKYPNLNRRITKEEYEKAEDYMYLCGIEDGFIQDFESASEEYTPNFDLTGVEKPEINPSDFK